MSEQKGIHFFTIEIGSGLSKTGAKIYSVGTNFFPSTNAPMTVSGGKGPSALVPAGSPT